LAFQIRLAGHKLLGLDQYTYLREMFGERANPFYTRLYYMLSADEDARLMEAKRDYESAGVIVRSLIYDGMMVETVRSDLLEKHGLVQKALPSWQDNFFMRWVCFQTSQLKVAAM
jgi:hypothetical protein